MEVQKTEDVLSTIFGSSTPVASLFSNNPFRRQTSAILEGVHLELKKRSTRVPERQYTSGSFESREEDDGSRGNKKKKRKIIEEASSESPYFPKELFQHENQIGSYSAVSAKKNNHGRTSKKLDSSVVVDNVFSKKEKAFLESHEEILKKKSKQQEDSVGQGARQGRRRDWLQECKEGKANLEKESKHGKGLFEPCDPGKRQKTSTEDVPKHDSAQGSIPIHLKSGLKKPKSGTKRKKEDTLEARYEKKLRGMDDIATAKDESRKTSATKEEKIRIESIHAQSKTRKRTEGDEKAAETVDPATFDADEKLKRTIFVGNLPLMVKKKSIMKEFSTYGPIESVRLRSVPLLDTKIPRKGAIIKGQINEAVDSQHAYVVFKFLPDANAALTHNMKEFSGNHVRVDIAYAPHGVRKGKSSLRYDHRRSLFVGNIPFDVKDEELYEAFTVGRSLELGIDAVRVVRDPQTSVSKGIAYVLFKKKAGANFFLSPKRQVKLRDRVLRISRVLVSQTMQKRPSHLSKHVRKLEEINNSQSQRKRAKLSASYEGVRARKEPSKERHKGTTSSSKQLGGGPNRIAGTKRKRVEKKQRGISRSKKTRRT